MNLRRAGDERVLRDYISFCSHEPSDQMLSFARRRCRRRRRCRKRFTFSSSSQAPLRQFQPNLAQIILG